MLRKALVGLAVLGVAIAQDLRMPVENAINLFTETTRVDNLSKITAICSSLADKYNTKKSTTINVRNCINTLSNGGTYTVATNGTYAQITPTGSRLLVRTWGSIDEEEIIRWEKKRKCNRIRIGFKITWNCKDIWYPITKPSEIVF